MVFWRMMAKGMLEEMDPVYKKSRPHALPR